MVLERNLADVFNLLTIPTGTQAPTERLLYRPLRALIDRFGDRVDLYALPSL